MRKQTLFPALALVAVMGACAAGNRTEDPMARMSPAQRANYTPPAAPTAAPPTDVATELPPTEIPTAAPTAAPLVYIPDEKAEATLRNATDDLPPISIWAEYLYVAGVAISVGFLSTAIFFLFAVWCAGVAFRRYAHLYVGIFSLNRRPPNERHNP